MRYIHNDVEKASLFELFSIRQMTVGHNAYGWLTRMIDQEIEARRARSEDWDENDNL